MVLIFCVKVDMRLWYAYILFARSLNSAHQLLQCE